MRDPALAKTPARSASPDIAPVLANVAQWNDNGNGRITFAEADRHGIAPVRRRHPDGPARSPVFSRHCSAPGRTPTPRTRMAGHRSTPRWHPSRTSSPLDPITVDALLEAGADPNARDYKTGGTALHIAAAISETPDVLAALLDAGADPDVRNDAGRTPLNVIPDDSPLRGTAAYLRLKDAPS